MSQERLSKLQKWILARIYKNTSISRKSIRGFYGKKAGGMFSRGETMTTAERVVIHRSVNSSLKRDIIKLGQYGDYYLTEKGFSVFLKVNEIPASTGKVNFKEYEDRRDQSLKEFKEGFMDKIDFLHSIGVIKKKKAKLSTTPRQESGETLDAM